MNHGLKKFDWESSDHHPLLNPRMPEPQARFLIQGLDEFLSKSYGRLEAHFFVLSSGTTAAGPADWKWVALKKSAVLASAEAVNRHLHSTSTDTWLNPLPEFHVGGLGIRARSYLSGAGCIPLEKWEPQSFVKKVKDCGVTLTSLVPTQVYDLVQQRLTCPHHAGKKTLRAILVGGGAISPALYFSALSLGWPLLLTYGMSETCSQVATSSLDSLKTLPRLDENSKEGFDPLRPPLPELLPHWEFETNAENDCLALRGSALLSGYLIPSRDPAQKGFIFEDPKKDGWFVCPDRIQVENNRFLRILGRRGDFVKIGGESVDLTHLRNRFEDARLEWNGESLLDCAILAVPDDRLGSVIHLITQRVTLDRAKTHPEVSVEKVAQLIRHFNSRVLAFERIRKWHQVERIPRTDLGKLIPAQCLSLLANQNCQTTDVN